MYLIVKATTLRADVVTAVTQNELRTATMGQQRYIVIDGSGRPVDMRNGGMTLEKFNILSSNLSAGKPKGRFLAIKWYQKQNPAAYMLDWTDDLNKAVAVIRASVDEDRGCNHVIIDSGRMVPVRFYRQGSKLSCITTIQSRVPRRLRQSKCLADSIASATLGSATQNQSIQIGDKLMKRIAIIVGNHVLSLPFSTTTLDLLLEADVLSFQFDSPDEFPDCHTKTFYHSDMKTEVTVIEQRDIKENPNVTSEREQRALEKLQAELDGYKKPCCNTGSRRQKPLTEIRG